MCYWGISGYLRLVTATVATTGNRNADELGSVTCAKVHGLKDALSSGSMGSDLKPRSY